MTQAVPKRIKTLQRCEEKSGQVKNELQRQLGIAVYQWECIEPMANPIHSTQLVSLNREDGIHYQLSTLSAKENVL